MSKDNIRWVTANFTSPKFKHSRLEYAPIKDVVEFLQEALAAQECGEWKDFSIEKEYDYGDTTNIVLQGKRPENEKERAIREETEKKNEEYQRRQYETLKKKYGDK